MRIFGLEGPASARNDPALLERLAPLVPARRPGDFNQALMELGALVCRPANPACLRCPVRLDCRAFAAGRQEVIPAPVRRSYQKITAVVGIIERDGRILIQRRPAEGLLGGLWEFPGGKVRPGESLPAALARELEEEIGAKPKAIRPFMTVDHSYTRFRVTLHAFTCGLRSDPPPDPNRRWVRPAGLREIPVPLRQRPHRGENPGRSTPGAMTEGLASAGPKSRSSGVYFLIRRTCSVVSPVIGMLMLAGAPTSTLPFKVPLISDLM